MNERMAHHITTELYITWNIYTWIRVKK